MHFFYAARFSTRPIAVRCQASGVLPDVLPFDSRHSRQPRLTILVSIRGQLTAADMQDGELGTGAYVRVARCDLRPEIAC